jgi:hypothetical protein
MTMSATDIYVQHLESASTLPALLAAGWDAFDFIARAAPGYDDPDSGHRGLVFMLAATTACRGRNALACAPSLPNDDVGTEAELEQLGDETRAAACLAGLAAVIWLRFADAPAASLGHDDGRACAAAVAAAAETHALLSGGGSP